MSDVCEKCVGKEPRNWYKRMNKCIKYLYGMR